MFPSIILSVYTQHSLFKVCIDYKQPALSYESLIFCFFEIGFFFIFVRGSTWFHQLSISRPSIFVGSIKLPNFTNFIATTNRHIPFDSPFHAEQYSPYILPSILYGSWVILCPMPYRPASTPSPSQFRPPIPTQFRLETKTGGGVFFLNLGRSLCFP